MSRCINSTQLKSHTGILCEQLFLWAPLDALTYTVTTLHQQWTSAGWLRTTAKTHFAIVVYLLRIITDVKCSYCRCNLHAVFRWSNPHINLLRQRVSVKPYKWTNGWLGFRLLAESVALYSWLRSKRMFVSSLFNLKINCALHWLSCKITAVGWNAWLSACFLIYSSFCSFSSA